MFSFEPWTKGCVKLFQWFVQMLFCEILWCDNKSIRLHTFRNSASGALNNCHVVNAKEKRMSICFSHISCLIQSVICFNCDQIWSPTFQLWNKYGRKRKQSLSRVQFRIESCCRFCNCDTTCSDRRSIARLSERFKRRRRSSSMSNISLTLKHVSCRCRVKHGEQTMSSFVTIVRSCTSIFCFQMMVLVYITCHTFLPHWTVVEFEHERVSVCAKLRFGFHFFLIEREQTIHVSKDFQHIKATWFLSLTFFIIFYSNCTQTNYSRFKIFEVTTLSSTVFVDTVSNRTYTNVSWWMYRCLRSTIRSTIKKNQIRILPVLIEFRFNVRTNALQWNMFNSVTTRNTSHKSVHCWRTTRHGHNNLKKMQTRQNHVRTRVWTNVNSNHWNERIEHVVGQDRWSDTVFSKPNWIGVEEFGINRQLFLENRWIIWRRGHTTVTLAPRKPTRYVWIWK